MLMLISKKVKMYQLWDNYRKTLFSVFPDLEYGDTWARWEGKGTSLIAKTYTNPNIIKLRNIFNEALQPTESTRTSHNSQMNT